MGGPHVKSAFIIQPQQDFTDFVAFARDEGSTGWS